MIVDEVHHLLAGSVREQRQSLNQLKFLSNELRMPVVALGTSEALYAMQADPQIAHLASSRLRCPGGMRAPRCESSSWVLVACYRCTSLRRSATR